MVASVAPKRTGPSPRPGKTPNGGCTRTRAIARLFTERGLLVGRALASVLGAEVVGFEALLLAVGLGSGLLQAKLSAQRVVRHRSWQLRLIAPNCTRLQC